MTISEERKQKLNRRQFFGRRKGPGLSPRKKAIFEKLYPRFGLEKPGQEAGTLIPDALFPKTCTGYALEIGFGKGEHLIEQAKHHVDTGFIGCEPYINGMIAILDRLQSEPLANVRVYDDDAREIIDALPDRSLQAVFLIHPDPWPKKRHAKRRFVNPDNLDALARILKPGGELRIVTDDPVYRQWTAICLSGRPDFEWMAEKPDDWRQPPETWTTTRYAAKATREGRWDCYFRYRRL